jgi:hypothetical protein
MMTLGLILLTLGFLGIVSDMAGWFEPNVGAIFLLLFSGIGLVLVGAVKSDSAARAEWMAECVKDHKEYECVAMWRAGDRRITPIPIIIPVR